MIKFNELTIPYLKEEISYTQWIDNICDALCKVINESIYEMSII